MYFIHRAIFIMLLLVSCSAQAAIQVYSFDTPAQEQTFYTLTNELRCPKCQNQTIADSDAMIAQDIKARIYQEVREGKTEQQIMAELTQRYGDFIHYRPSFKLNTAVLWLGPPVLLIMVVTLVLVNIRGRSNDVEVEEEDA